jgi:hypothetical protein
MAGVTGEFAVLMAAERLISIVNLPVDSVVFEARSDSVTMELAGYRALRPLIKVRGSAP